MKRFAPWTLLLVTVLVIVAPLAFAAATAQPAAAVRQDKSPAAPIATALSTITGIAISPLLGTGAYGLYQWVKADDTARAKLPWYAKPAFWLPALLVVGLCAAKDAFGTAVPPGMKKPLDVLETIENKFSGLIAAGAVVPFAIDAMSKMIFDTGAPPTAGLVVGTSGLATIQFAAADLTWLLNLLTVPFGIAIFLIVWLGSHAINVLILLSPWGAIDAALKVARTALLGLVTLSATLNPWVGAILSLAVIVVAYLVAGWAFRLTVFGAVYCWEFLTRRKHRFDPAQHAHKMFAGSSFSSVPIRTYGRLQRNAEGAMVFEYRPWLVGRPCSVPVAFETHTLSVGEGALFSDIVDAEDRTIFSLPPRYRGHEAVVVKVYVFGGGVRPAGLRKAWGALREMLGGKAIKPELTAGT